MTHEEIMRTWQEHLTEQEQDRREQERTAAVEVERQQVLAADKALERAAAAVNRAYQRRREQELKLINLVDVKGGQELNMAVPPKELERLELTKKIGIVAKNERRQGKIKTAARMKKIRIAARTAAIDVQTWQKEQELLCRAFNLCVITAAEKSRLEEFPLAFKPQAVDNLRRLERELEDISSEEKAVK